LATLLTKFQIPKPKPQTTIFIWSLERGIWDFKLVPVAQPDRASDFGSEGWGFESLQARHISRFVAVMSPLKNAISEHLRRCSGIWQGVDGLLQNARAHKRAVYNLRGIKYGRGHEQFGRKNTHGV